MIEINNIARLSPSLLSGGVSALPDDRLPFSDHVDSFTSQPEDEKSFYSTFSNFKTSSNQSRQLHEIIDLCDHAVLIKSFSNSEVVPRSVVNPDFLEPLNCKGLFTTNAKTQCLNKKPLEKVFCRQLAGCSSSLKNNELDNLPDRNPKSGLIGVGLSSGLRTLFYEN